MIQVNYSIYKLKYFQIFRRYWLDAFNWSAKRREPIASNSNVTIWSKACPLVCNIAAATPSGITPIPKSIKPVITANMPQYCMVIKNPSIHNANQYTHEPICNARAARCLVASKKVSATRIRADNPKAGTIVFEKTGKISSLHNPRLSTTPSAITTGKHIRTRPIHAKLPRFSSFHLAFEFRARPFWAGIPSSTSPSTGCLELSVRLSSDLTAIPLA